MASASDHDGAHDAVLRVPVELSQDGLLGSSDLELERDTVLHEEVEPVACADPLLALELQAGSVELTSDCSLDGRLVRREESSPTEGSENRRDSALDFDSR